ncbi:MAG: alpha/beta fold hydrolase, partial [Gammaproteobacteria bacterium]
MTDPRELRLPLGWGELAALAWHRPGRPRVLCLHGWMDNAASFVPLAEQLTGCDLVALENAGHGHSDHRPAGARYHFHDYVFDLDAALDALAWERATLVGHSLGSGVAATLACAAPERVERLVMLDGMGVMSEPADRLPDRLRRSLRSVRRPRQHRRVFERVGDAARVRQSAMPMADRSARLLAERALQECAGGWRWRTDARAMWESPAWM